MDSTSLQLFIGMSTILISIVSALVLVTFHSGRYSKSIDHLAYQIDKLDNRIEKLDQKVDLISDRVTLLGNEVAYIRGAQQMT